MEALYRLASRRTETPRQRWVIQQKPNGVDDGLGTAAVYPQPGPAVSSGVRYPSASSRHDWNATGGCLAQRDTEALDHELSGPRHSQVDLRQVVEPGKILVRHCGEKTHPIPDAQALRQRLQPALH